MASCESLVSCEWLKEQLDKGNPDIKVLDGTWNMAMWKRDAAQEYRDGHIPGAVRFDIAEVRDKEAGPGLALMLPPVKQFEQQVGQLGVSNSSHVVIYDNHAKFGFYSAGRVWWMFKIFGHEKVSVLDGGIPKWLSGGYPVETGPEPSVASVSYTANFNPALLRDLKQVQQALEGKTEQVVDGRPKGRFDGVAPEPNPAVRSGHMLGSMNVPFTELVDPNTKTLKTKDEIRKIFESAGVDLEKPILVTCGSAVVAGLLALSLYQLGKAVPVYDGSWFDWFSHAPDETKHLGVKRDEVK